MDTHQFLRRAGLALILTGGATWIGCSGKPAASPEPVVAVQAATVGRKTIREVISTEALLYARSQVSIVPKISAPIQKFYANRGGLVHAGQLLATLENKDLQAALDQAKGAYEQAQANYATNTKVDLPAQIQSAELSVEETRQAMQASQLVYQSRQKLFEAGAIARNLMDQSHVSYIQARNQYEIALAKLKGLQAVGQKAGFQSAQGQLASAKGAYEAALANLQYSQIRSPIDGVVTDRPLFEGQMAAAGSPLMTVMDLAHVIGRAYVSPQQAALLHVGDPASLAPVQGQADVPAKVTVVSPALDPNSTTVQVWVEANNPGDRLKPGSTVPVNMVAKTVKNALAVPAAAVLTAPDGTTSVMVIGPDQVAHQTNVKEGIREGDEVQIVSGLRAGQQVVTTGAYSVPDGTKVQIVSAAGAGN
ncbi:MAG TPA: efflux RND transporter periplasmic adaptor subunit [Patescibacteria group bacterium]|nr:efflux RND transporter periplasmic adaptor subunit [Patescibacteria group bacterium]